MRLRGIEGPAIESCDDLDVVWVECVGLDFECAGRCYHFQFRIALKGAGETVDETRSRAGSSPWTLMMCPTPRSLAATSATRSVPLMPGRSQGDLCAERKGSLGDAHVIRCDNGFSERSGLVTAVPNVLDKRLAKDGEKRLAGKRVDAQPGGDDCGDFHVISLRMI